MAKKEIAMLGKALVLGFALALGACSDSHTMKSQGQTHWLQACDSDSDCGGLSCECGVCVASCGEGVACDVSGHATECFVSSSAVVETLCGAGNAANMALCLEPCSSSCDDGQVCVAGGCIPESVPSPDASTMDAAQADGSAAVPPRDSTHWLQACDSDSDCGELRCMCGHCVAPCVNNQCNVSGIETQCNAGGIIALEALCGSEPAPLAPLCLEPCRLPADCDEGQVCSWGGGGCVPMPDGGPSDGGVIADASSLPEPPTGSFTIGLRNESSSPVFAQTRSCNGHPMWFALNVDGESQTVQAAQGCDCRSFDPSVGCPTPPPVCGLGEGERIEPGGEITYTWDTGHWVRSATQDCAYRLPVTEDERLVYRACWLHELPEPSEWDSLNYPDDFSCTDVAFTLGGDPEEKWLTITD